MARINIKLVKVRATTANITRGIINYLNMRGHYAFRVNSTGIWDPAKQLFRRPNQRRGIADIICCLHYRKSLETLSGYVNFNLGLFLAIEIKNEITGDKTTKHQKDFSQEIGRVGGIYIVAKSYSDFTDWYEKQDFEKEVI